jgi:hypothetical protein
MSHHRLLTTHVSALPHAFRCGGRRDTCATIADGRDEKRKDADVHKVSKVRAPGRQQRSARLDQAMNT